MLVQCLDSQGSHYCAQAPDLNAFVDISFKFLLCDHQRQYHAQQVLANIVCEIALQILLSFIVALLFRRKITRINFLPGMMIFN